MGVKLAWLKEHHINVQLVIWLLLVPPTLTIWSESVRWLNFMSIYAIITGLVAAREGKKAQ